ncbi:NB-ARC domains-containing protein [Tanacetum coccineum]
MKKPPNLATFPPTNTHPRSKGNQPSKIGALIGGITRRGVKLLFTLRSNPKSNNAISGYCNLEQVPESIGGLSCLERLNLKGNNLLEVPEIIGGLSCLWQLNLIRNNFTSLPGSLSQLSHLGQLNVSGCRKLEVLPELPPSIWRINASDCTSLREVLPELPPSIWRINASDCTSLREVLPELPPSIWRINASDCTSLREVSGSSKDPFRKSISNFKNCPKLFKNVTIDSEGFISKTHDSSITSQGFIHPFSLGIMVCRLTEWFTNRSRENHVKVELPSHWCYDKFRGFGTCVVFKCKKPFNIFQGYSVKNFDGASITEGYFPGDFKELVKREVIGTQDSYMIWLNYRRDTGNTWAWKEAKNFVTFSFFEENNEEDYEVQERGVRLICDEDREQKADLSMLQGLPTPTQHGGVLSLNVVYWTW